MSRWKSRWSRPRLRNTATSKAKPFTRPITSAWLETSIAHASTPRSSICRSSRCRSGASGVVRAETTSSPSIRVPTVPITAAGTPAPDSPPSRSRVVVVFPWVPVTPTIRSRVAGSSYTTAARRPRTGRTSGTTSIGRSRTCSATCGIGDDGDGSRLVGLRPVLDPVSVAAGQGDEEVAGRDAPRVEGHAPDPDAQVAGAAHGHTLVGQPAGQVGEGQSALRGLRVARHGPEAIEPRHPSLRGRRGRREIEERSAPPVPAKGGRRVSRFGAG